MLIKTEQGSEPIPTEDNRYLHIREARMTMLLLKHNCKIKILNLDSPERNHQQDLLILITKTGIPLVFIINMILQGCITIECIGLVQRKRIKINKFP